MTAKTLTYAAPRQLAIVAMLLIAVAGFGVYANTLRNPFIWDDEPLIVNNAYVKSPAYLAKIFTEDMGAGSGTKYHSYRPFQIATYLADRMAWGSNAAGYHLTNIICHALAAICIFWLVLILFGDALLAFSTSLLFAINPLHTEAVAYISGRSDPLAAVFLLAALIFYIEYLKRQKAVLCGAMAVCYALALLSKETAVIFPALVILYHVIFKRRVRAGQALMVATITVAYVIFRTTALGALLTHVMSPTTLIQRLPGFFAALGQYLRLLVAPFGLHMEYGLKLFRFAEPIALAGIAVSAALAWLIIMTWRDKPLVAFSVSWFLITLAPVSNLYPLNAYMAEHWLYLPSIGFFLIVSSGLCRMYRDRRWKIAALMLFGGLVVFYAVLTIRQNGYWRDPVIFYERTLRYAPESDIMHLNLGNSYLSLGRKEEAIVEYRKAISFNPKNAKAYQNIGFVLDGMGKSAEAVEYLRKAIELKGDDASAWNNLGNAYHGMGNIAEAVMSYKKAIEVNPYYGRAYYNLGNTIYFLGEREAAAASLERAIALDPDFVDAYNNLAMVYNALGRRRDAIALLKKALAIAPGYGFGHANISRFYFEAGEYELAKRHAAIASGLGQAINPGFLKELETK